MAVHPGLLADHEAELAAVDLRVEKLCASAARDSREACAPPSSMTSSSSAGTAARATPSPPPGAPSGGVAILSPAPSGAL
jgi:hypothetical protein